MLALSVDFLLDRALLHNIEYIMTFAPEPIPCTTECHIGQLVLLWVFGMLLCMLQLYYRAGMLQSCMKSHGNYIPLSAANTAAEDVASTSFKQRTFSYPDTLISNYIDPDEIPELLKPHSENIYVIAQSVMHLHGFQVDNSRNQAEHLLMLLFNETSTSDRMVSGPALRIHKRIFSNYRKWCESLCVQPLLMRDLSPIKSHEILVEDLLVFLLIWGEAANLRHMPECLCFLFHKIMEEHVRMKRSPAGQQRTGKYPGFFLDMVVTPLYEEIAKSMNKSVDHAEKKIYDDFNEFFWSPNCLKYQLHNAPLFNDDLSERGLAIARPKANDLATALRNAPKSYLEKRSWLHPLLSVNRLFEWHVVAFTLLATWSFSSLLQWTYAFTIQIGSFVFWEITFMGLMWTCLEVWTLFPSTNLSDPSLFGYLIRILAGYLVLSYQTVYFHWSFVERGDTPLKQIDMFNRGDNMFWWWQYVWLSLIACSFYLLQSVMSWFPAITTSIMTWRNDLVQSFLSVMYPISQLLVGKSTHMLQKEVFRYIAFWLVLLVFKLWFGYRFVVSPVCVPTLQLYDDYMNFTHTSFSKTALLIFFWWFPHFLVFIIDLSIWYACWSSAIGGFIAITARLGAVRDSQSFRSHFTRAPVFFEQKFMPTASSFPKEKLPSHLSTMSFSELAMAAVPGGKSNISSINERTPLLEASGRTKSAADISSSYNTGSIRGPMLDLSRVVSENLANDRSRRWIIFGRIWNEIVSKLRDTDHINNKERDLLLFTSFDWLSKPIYLPLFQTAGCVEQVALAFMDSSKEFHTETDKQLKMKVIENYHKSLTSTAQSAVIEAWELSAWMVSEVLGNLHMEDCHSFIMLMSNWALNLDILARFSGDPIKTILKHLTNVTSILLSAIPKRRANPVVPHDYNLAKSESKPNFPNSPSHDKAIKKSVSTGFLSALEGASNETHKQQFAKLQPFRKNNDLIDNVREKVKDELKALLKSLRNALKTSNSSHADVLTASKNLTFILQLESGFFSNDVYASKNIDIFCKDPCFESALKKLDSLLKLRLTQVELKSHEANRRLNFFLNSLYMDVPQVPGARYCKEYTTITPYYSEDILLTKADLVTMNSDKVSVILYLQTLYKDDWNNFLERRGINDESTIWQSTHLQELRMWASMRAQTLFRTVEGMMHSEAAVRLLAELEGIDNKQCDLLAKLKFNYVVACQVYGVFKNNLDSKADDIEFLLARHPNLRVAYIDAYRSNPHEVSYYSVLIKSEVVTAEGESKEEGKKVIKEVFRIKLPGNPVLGEGKPENQNHAVIFTRGRFLQAIDMNQDGYFEEALKMRNLLEEFNKQCAIVGFREHIFTGSVSSVANYMALQELSFVTLGQRVLNQPLRIRQHYGHPDLFDKFFVMTEGGMSKASKGINLSEDVFAGFNATIRGHKVDFVEYVQVGKGRDVGLQQTYKFEAKLSQGNAEQSLSRDVDRICNRLDFFRLLSFYYGGIGHYLSNVLVMFTLVIVVYTMLAQAIYNEEGVNGRAILPEGVLQLALAGMGILQTLPLAVTLTVEKGFRQAISEIGFMILSGGPLYFIFHIQTKSYYFSQTLLAGGAMYRPTGRGFVTQHAPFDDTLRFFASSHIYLGFELAAALIIFGLYTKSKQYAGLTWSLWLASISFMFGPFWFNPLSFEWTRLSEDYYAWMRWMAERGGNSEQSWESWWKEENNFYQKISFTWKLFLFIQKSILWIFIAVGLVGSKLLHSKGDRILVFEMFAIVLGYLVVKYILDTMERHFMYPTRRFLSLSVSAIVGSAMIYLFFTHSKFLLYTVGGYYFFSAISFVILLSGSYSIVMPLYKVHDYVVGHVIFFLLVVASILQLGYVQTWLLYQNALSKGIEIEDILQYARRTKEKAHNENETVTELKTKIQSQEKKIQELIELAQKHHLTSSPSAGNAHLHPVNSIPEFMRHVPSGISLVHENSLMQKQVS